MSPACRRSSASTRSSRAEASRALGYNVAVHGQKTYNGVALLSKRPLEDVRKGLPGDDGDDHARYIEAVVSAEPAVRVASHLPAQRQSDRHRQVRLQARLDGAAERATPPSCWPTRSRWRSAATTTSSPSRATPTIPQPGPATPCSSPRRARAFRALNWLGLTDAYTRRRRRAGRLHLLGLSGRRLAAEPRHPHRPPAALAAGRRPAAAGDDPQARRGRDKPSDHVPIRVELAA